MLVPIICAIVAVVGLITLISFNMVIREKESMHEELSAPKQEKEPINEPGESVEMQENKEQIDDYTTKETMADRDYRNALKRFQGNKELLTQKQQDDQQKMSDNAYREALRAMKRKK